jgi:hypothetical protein
MKHKYNVEDYLQIPIPWKVGDAVKRKGDDTIYIIEEFLDKGDIRLKYFGHNFEDKFKILNSGKLEKQ